MRKLAPLLLAVALGLSLGAPRAVYAEANAGQVSAFNDRVSTAVYHNNLARNQFKAAVLVLGQGNITLYTNLYGRAVESLGRAYSSIDDAAQVAASANDAYLSAVATGILANIAATDASMKTANTMASLVVGEDGSFWYSAGSLAVSGSVDGDLIIQGDPGFWQVQSPSGETWIQPGPNGDFIHVTAMGTCMQGCQFVGASVIVFAPDSPGNLGDYIPLYYSPIDPFTEEALRQIAMLDQPYCDTCDLP